MSMVSPVDHDGAAVPAAPRPVDPSAIEPIRQLLRSRAEVTFVLDAAGNVVAAAGATSALLGFSAREVQGRPLLAFVHSEDVAQLNALLDHAGTAQAESPNVIVRFRHADKVATTLPLAVRAMPGGTAIGGADLELIAREHVTASAIQTALRFDIAGAAQVSERSPFGMFFLDGTGRCISVNSTWHELTGQTPTNALGLGWLQIIDEPDRLAFRGVAAAAHSSRSGWRQSLTVAKTDGRTKVSVDMAAAPILDEHRAIRGYVGVMLRTPPVEPEAGDPVPEWLSNPFVPAPDVATAVDLRTQGGPDAPADFTLTSQLPRTDDVVSLADPDEMPTSDELTGLPNRALFMRRVEESVERMASDGVSVACMRISLVGYREARANLGDKVGDDYLYVIGKRLASMTRSVDSPGRIDHDEFAVLSVGWFFNGDIENVTRRFLKRLGEPLPSKHGEVLLRPTVGVAMLQPGEDSASLLARAARARSKALAIGAGHGVVDHGPDTDNTTV